MRLLHTSDWHLGRTLHEASLEDAQRGFLQWLVDAVDRHDVDAVVVAGDVFDRGVPPLWSVDALTDALARLVERVPVLLLSGNHDSHQRLGFGAPLHRDGLRVVTRFDDAVRPMVLPDEAGDVHLYGLPYVELDRYRSHIAAAGIAEEDRPARAHDACVRHLMDAVRADIRERASLAAQVGRTRPRTVVAAHAFVVGDGATRDAAVMSESERDLRVGGLDVVYSSAFAGVDYVALGHLHGAQQPSFAPVDGRSTLLRYSGSPLRFSFSEEGHVKSVTLVDLAEDGSAAVTTLDVPQPRGMVTLIGDLEHLLADPAHDAHRESWVRAVVTDTVRPDRIHPRLKARFPFLLLSSHEPPGRTPRVAATGASRTVADPVDVTVAFVAEVTGRDPRDSEVAAAREAVEFVRAAQVGA